MNSELFRFGNKLQYGVWIIGSRRAVVGNLSLISMRQYALIFTASNRYISNFELVSIEALDEEKSCKNL